MSTDKEIRDRSYKIEKCCFNCRHGFWSVDDTFWCHLTEYEGKEVDRCGTCDLWEGEQL